MLLGQPKLFLYFFSNAVSLDLNFVNVYFFYLHGDFRLGILNVFETNKHLNKMHVHVGQLRSYSIYVTALFHVHFLKELVPELSECLKTSHCK